MTDLTSPNDPTKVPDDWYLERMRNERNRLLAASDWTMLPDAPGPRAQWTTYRQALRDFPAAWKPGPKADFPTPPNTNGRD